MSNQKVCCFGELLLRFSPVAENWISQNTMPVFVGGAELNVATALANWQIPVKYNTVLPVNQLSQEIKASIESKNIDASSIINAGNRIGIYYLPQGTDLKSGGVIYDRAYSSFSELKPQTIDWEKVLENTNWLHFSAISPALNQNVADTCKELLALAQQKNIKISVDLNYRAKLWQYGKEPIEIMPELVQYADVIMGNIWAAEKLLGVPVNLPENPSQENYLEHSEKTSRAIQQKFPNCKTVANTFRFDYKTTGIEYYATLFQEEQLYVSKTLKTETVVDRVGSGDCFMAGLIYGLYKNNAAQNIIDFSAKAAFGKLQEFGDATKQTVETVISVE